MGSCITVGETCLGGHVSLAIARLKRGTLGVNSGTPGPGAIAKGT